MPRSTNRPLATLPIVIPTPNTMSTIGTVAALRPVISVVMGAMYVYAENRPPNPIAPSATASHTCTLAKARSSLPIVAVGSPGPRGTAIHTATKVSANATATTR